MLGETMLIIGDKSEGDGRLEAGDELEVPLGDGFRLKDAGAESDLEELGLDEGNRVLLGAGVTERV